MSVNWHFKAPSVYCHFPDQWSTTVNHLYFLTNALNCIKLFKVKIYMYQYFKRQLKTPTCFGSFMIHPQGVLKVLHWNYLWCFVCVVGVWQREIWTLTFRFILQSKFRAAKHRLRTQNITSNFSEALSILPVDGSQRIRNTSEFLIVF